MGPAGELTEEPPSGVHAFTYRSGAMWRMVGPECGSHIR